MSIGNITTSDLFKIYGEKEKHVPLGNSVVDFDSVDGVIDITIQYITEVPYEKKIPLSTIHIVQRLVNVIKDAKKEIDYPFDKACAVFIQINSKRKMRNILSHIATVDVVIRELFDNVHNVHELTIIQSGKKTKITNVRIKIIEL